MASVAAGLLDTSVFIASETGRVLRTDDLPAESSVCVVTVAELQAGVLRLETQALARVAWPLWKRSAAWNLCQWTPPHHGTGRVFDSALP